MEAAPLSGVLGNQVHILRPRKAASVPWGPRGLDLDLGNAPCLWPWPENVGICAPVPLREDGENTAWSRCLTRCRHLMNTFPLNEKRINERMHARFSEVTCKVRAKS